MTMAKTALDGAKRDTIFRIRYNDPAVKVEVIENPDHPEYDPRVLKPVDQSLVWSMRHQGQINAATAYKADEDESGITRIILTSGRQRWKAMQQIWEDEQREGIEPADMSTFKVAIQKLSDERGRIELSLAENEQRVQDEPIERARKVRKYLDRVGEDEVTKSRACALFRIPSKDQLVNLLKLLELTPSAQAAVSAGEITPTLGAQISRLPAQEQEQVVEKIKDAPARPSVREGKEIIREVTGASPKYEMVNIRQVEKELDKKERQLESALSKLEECEGPYDKKMPERAAKVSEIRGYIDALRWARGETVVPSADGPTNDKASAAWDALRDALTSAAWPKVLRASDFPAIPSPWGHDVTPEQRAERNRMRAERDDAIRDSKVLVVAGERVAYHEGDGIDVDCIRIDTASKWFQRLMDPYGIPSALVRDFGVHGWLAGKNDLGSLSTWKLSFAPLSKGRTTILVSEAQVAKWASDVPEFGRMYSVEDLVFGIVAENVGRMASDITRENRFGSPWFGVDADDETLGPDLSEDRGMREQIRDDLDAALGLHRNRTNIGDDECTWATVGDLIDYIEARVKQVADAGAAATTLDESGEAGSTEDHGDGAI
jgi:hypothetical protein